jgi:hypothetical protein
MRLQNKSNPKGHNWSSERRRWRRGLSRFKDNAAKFITFVWAARSASSPDPHITTHTYALNICRLIYSRHWMVDSVCFAAKKVSLDRGASRLSFDCFYAMWCALSVNHNVLWPGAVGTVGNHLSARCEPESGSICVCGRSTRIVFNANLAAFVNICYLRFIDFTLFLTQQKGCKTCVLKGILHSTVSHPKNR